MSTRARIIRSLAGLILLSLVFVGPKTNWGYIGLVPLVFGLTGFCPACVIMSKIRNKECKSCGIDGKDCK
ncbi:MAG TPA: DUF2892 domain-containing protein [Nitrospirota bacterium]